MAPEWPGRANSYGTALLDRYLAGGSLSDLDNAIEVVRRSLDSARDPSQAPQIALNLASALSLRFDRNEDFADLEEAIDLRRRALSVIPPDGAAYADRQATLGNDLVKRGRLTQSPADVDEGLELLEHAAAAVPAEHPMRGGLLNNLAVGWLSRWSLTEEPDVLDRAIELHEQAIAESAPDAPYLVTLLGNLGDQLRGRYRLAGDPADLSRAAEASRRSLRLAADRDAPLALEKAIHWCDEAVGQQQWEEAVEAGAVGLPILERLFTTQVLRTHKTTWLREGSGLAGNYSYALARLGRLDEAVVALERGRAALLAEMLEYRSVDAARLRAAGEHELASEYEDAVTGLNALEAADRPEGDHGRRVAEARELVVELRGRISRLPGFEDYGSPLELSDVLAATPHPLVYVVSTGAGGMALVVAAGASDVIWLPDLDADTLAARGTEYFRAVFDGRFDARPLEDMTRWLWDAAMAPVIERVPDGSVTLVPAGLLGILPLHAAWTEDPDQPTGRRYVIDDVTCAYTPNARALAATKRDAGAAPLEHTVCIEQPEPVDADVLDAAADEIAAVCAARGADHCVVLRGAAATRAAALEAAANALVIHFACHGLVDFDEPLQSGLIMAHDERLTLGDLLQSRLDGTRLVVLSACESAVAGAEVLDEVLSLPTGLIQAGAAGAIGSMWPVPDIPTALLMARFHELWDPDTGSPGLALRQAQRWIRDASDREKHARFPDIWPAEFGTDEERSLQHPQYWAAFAVHGR